MPAKVTVLSILRKKAGLTQIDLANQVGSTQPEISLAETGYTRPRFEVLQALSRVLGVEEPEDLLRDYEDYVKAGHQV